MGPILRIEMFGGFRAKLGNQIVAEFPAQQSSILLALLALEPGKSYAREDLIVRLWPEIAPDEGRQRLRQLLYNLRRQLERLPFAKDSLLPATTSHIKLNSAVLRTDAAEFIETLCAARETADPRERTHFLTHATDLYRGDLLPGFYQDDIIVERNRLETACLEALGDLTQALERLQETSAALEVARRAVTLDPLREEAQLQLIRLYAATGRQATALRQYQEWERALQADLGIAPSESARLLLEQLRNDGVTAVHKQSEPPTQPASSSFFLLPSAASDPIGASFSIPPLTPETQETNEAAATVEFVSPANPQTSPSAPSKLRSARRRTLWLASATALALLAALLIVFRPNRPVVESAAGAQLGKEQWAARFLKQPGDNDTQPSALVADNAGCLYVCGFVQTAQHDADYVVLKYGPDGVLLHEARYNSPNNDCDRACSLALDGHGNLYVLGDCYHGETTRGSTDFDLVLIKYDADLRQQWVRSYDGPAHSRDMAAQVVVDDLGNAYVIGNSRRTDQITDFVTLKYAPDGRRLWEQRYNPALHPWNIVRCTVLDMAIDKKAGAIYVTGFASLSDANQAQVGEGDTFLTVKYDLNGDLLWMRRYRAPEEANAQAHRVCLDGDGGIYVAGVSDLGQNKNPVGTIVRYAADGRRLWERNTAGVFASGCINTMAVDAQGNATVAGWAYGSRGDEDLVIAQYDRAGRLRWQHQVNGKGDRKDWAGDVMADASGNVTVCGMAYSGSPEMGGTGSDYITLRYDCDGAIRWMRAYDGPVHESDKALHLTQDRAGNIYVTGQSRSQTANDITTVKYAP